MSGRWLAPVALGVALLSLALNGYLLMQLRQPERWAVPAVERILDRALGADRTFRHTVRIPKGTPLRLDVPVNERFSIAVDTVLPVNTRVRVPLETPFGTRSVSVPLRADIPLRTRLPLHIRHTFRLRTRTTQEIAVPIEIRLQDLPFGGGTEPR